MQEFDVRACVAVKQCRCLDELFPVPASFALEGVMGFGAGAFLELEQLS